MSIWKYSCTNIVILVCTMYGHAAFALTSYDELRLLGLASGATQIISHPTIGGTFQYAASDPYGYDGDNGTIIKAEPSDGGYWLRQFTYDLNNPIELDWFEPDQSTDLTLIIQDLVLEKNGTLYLKAPSTAMTLNASADTFTNINTFHFIENDVALTVALSERRLFSQDGNIDANDPNDLDRLIWTEDTTVANRWHANLSDIAINEPIQNLWAEEPDGKVMHWGRPVSEETDVTGVSGKEAGHMRWYSDASTLTVWATQTPALHFSQLEVSPDSYLQMWHFVGPEEVVLGGLQRNMTFTGSFRTELASLGAWNWVQNYTGAGGHGKGAPTAGADGSNLGLIGFKSVGSSTTDHVEVRANFGQCFGSCINVVGSTAGVNSNSLNSFEKFTLDGTVSSNGLRFNSGLIHLHLDDVWISDPWSTGAGWSGEPFPDNRDLRLYGNKSAGFSSTFVGHVTGKVTLQYGGGGYDFGPRNGTYTHGTDLSWQGSTPGILQTNTVDSVTELWTLGASLGPMATTLENDGDWQWSNGQLQVYSDGALLSDSLTAVHQRLTIRYKDIGWTESGTRSDYKHFGFKVDSTGTSVPNESFIQFSLLPGDFGTFGIQGGMVKLEATNENTLPVWNLSGDAWSQDMVDPNLWTLQLPPTLTGTLVLMGNGRVLIPVLELADLSVLDIEDGRWYASGTTLTMAAGQNPSALFDLLVGGLGSYKNEYHNIAIDGLDAVRDYSLSLAANPTADVVSSILEDENGQDYSQLHTFVGAIDGSIAMHSGTLRLHEQIKVNDFLGYDIHVFNTPHTIKPSVDYGAAFTRYGRGNQLTNVTLNGQLSLAGGSRENTAENLRFIGLPRPVVRILNNPTDPITEISLNNVQAPAGSSIVADSIINVDVKLDGIPVQLPYYFGAPQQHAGSVKNVNSNTWALYHLDGSIINAAPSDPFTQFWDKTSYIPVTDTNLPGFQMASKNGGFAARTLSMDTFNNGINLSFWAALAPEQQGLWAILAYFKGSDNDEFYARIRNGEELHVIVKTVDGSQSLVLEDFNEISNAVDGKSHHYQIAFNPTGDRRIRVALDGILRWVSPPVIGSAVWRNVDDYLNPGQSRRGQLGIFCSWSGCGGNQTQGVIDEVHIQQCSIGDTVCSELSDVTTIESIEDLDGDNMLDSWEELYLLDPSNPTDATQDTDDDGLINSSEFTAGTNPLVEDTDADGFSDGDEVIAGTSPLDNTSFIPDGDINIDGDVNVVDILLGQRILAGAITPTQQQLNHGDVAPLIEGIPQPNGDFTLGDLLLIQRKALGAINF